MIDSWGGRGGRPKPREDLAAVLLKGHAEYSLLSVDRDPRERSGDAPPGGGGGRARPQIQ